MLNQFAIATLNHLLAQAAWACEKLKPHTGRVALLVSAPVALRLQVDADGRFAEAAADTPADATIELPTAALPQILHGFDAVSRQVSVSGNADFAETLGHVLRNLRWDVESDLAACVGDIAAHRLTRLGRRFIDWQRELARNLAENAVEYLTEERPAIVGRRDAERFSRDVGAAADRLAQLEKRIDALEAARHGR